MLSRIEAENNVGSLAVKELKTQLRLFSAAETPNLALQTQFLFYTTTGPALSNPFRCAIFSRCLDRKIAQSIELQLISQIRFCPPTR
jgi:hypothetical protein